MQAYVTSDVGRVREINEDYFSVSYPNDEVQLFIIADGMGGYDGGEVASKIAVQTAKNYILTNFEKTPKTKEELLELVKSSCQYANMIVYEKKKRNARSTKYGNNIGYLFNTPK